MFANERQQTIYEIIKKKGAVTTTELTDRLNVSIETIRRDLMLLEECRLINRVHGGAMLPSNTNTFNKLSQRVDEHKAEKRELSEIGSRFIENGDIIALDSGSTVIELMDIIIEKFDKLTIVTHSLDVFERASVKSGFDIILTGGHYLHDERSFFGPVTADTLKRLHVNKSFIFPSAISINGGICDFNFKLADIQRYMMDIADKIYVLADSSKYEKNALLKISDLNNSFTFITDSGLSDEIKELYIENNINLING